MTSQDLLRIANDLSRIERSASKPSYSDYVKEKKRKKEKPLSKKEWEQKILGKGKKDDKSEADAKKRVEKYKIPSGVKVTYKKDGSAQMQITPTKLPKFKEALADIKKQFNAAGGPSAYARKHSTGAADHRFYMKQAENALKGNKLRLTVNSKGRLYLGSPVGDYVDSLDAAVDAYSKELKRMLGLSGR